MLKSHSEEEIQLTLEVDAEGNGSNWVCLSGGVVLGGAETWPTYF